VSATFDLDAYEAAGLLQGMFWAQGWYNKKACARDGWVHVGDRDSRIMIRPDFALFTARFYWKELEK
jgi:hypothetical protein